MADELIISAEGYTQRINSYYNMMGAAEKRVADYILGAPLKDVTALMTVNELARQAHVSTATVIRFCKTIGFEGFSEFKFFLQKLPQGISNDTALLNAPPNASAIKEKVMALTNSAVASTVMLIDNQMLERAIAAIADCGTVFIWGQGTASGVALAAAASFINMGIRAEQCFDTVTAIRNISFMGPKDVLIVINRNGRFRSGLQLVEAGKRHGMTTIAITEDFSSPLAKECDIQLCTALNDQTLPIMLPSITLCQHLTIQLLQVGVLLRNFDLLKEQIDEMYDVVDMN